MSSKTLVLMFVVTTFILISSGQRVVASSCEKRTLDPTRTMLHCKQKTNDSKVYWMKGATPIFDGTNILTSHSKDYEIETRYVYDRNLVIKGTRRALEGQYKCLKSNPKEILFCYNVSLLSNTELKSTTETPKLMNATYSKTVTAGDTVDLWCNNTDDTMWYVVDRDTQEDINIRGRKLQIRDISQDCGNVFKCKKDEKELCTWKLNILPKLTILVNGVSENETETKKNDHITISCTGVTSYKLRFRWYFQKNKHNKDEIISTDELVLFQFGPFYNATVSENSNWKNSNITFRSQKETKGRYRCEAQVVDTMENTNLVTKSNTVKVK